MTNDSQAGGSRPAMPNGIPAGAERNPDIDPDAVPVRPAATVMLVRPASDESTGVEVFMLRRTGRAAFGAGMFVFPGGRVDPADGGDDIAGLCVGRDDVSTSAELHIDTGGLAYWVAAIRECFEEAGVLLAQRPDGGALDVDDNARRLVHDGSLGLAELCVREGLVLDLTSTEYVAHWITPKGETARRFDTRFFLTEAPSDQVPLHDDSETVASMWLTPAAAIAMFEAGEMMMMPPTLTCLRWLSEFATPADALAAGAALDPPRILPKLRLDANGDVVGVSLPDDDDYNQL